MTVLDASFGITNHELKIEEFKTSKGFQEQVLREGMSSLDLMTALAPSLIPGDQRTVERDRSFLLVRHSHEHGYFRDTNLAIDSVRTFLRNLIHVPGLRPGTPERIYPKTAVGDAFPGTFDDYFASVLSNWKREKNDKLESVGRSLEHLGLTWKVEIDEVSDTSLAIRVGRLPHERRHPTGGAVKNSAGTGDLVDLADVGFGVSQALPVVVALWAAKKGDTVYLEQPELHLHPMAQKNMASVLADAANRGVRVICETHSSMLLLGVQTLVAEGKLKPDL